jgi:inorganic pyrophosphatase
MPSIANIPAGRDIPRDFNVIIEIPAEGGEIKYEIDKDSGLLMVDRFMATAMRYPCNYGFVPGTLALDGDPADVLVLTPAPIQPGAIIRVRPIGLLQMTDEAGEDSKILAVPIEKLCQRSVQIQELNDVPHVFLEKISHFFEHYKALEPNKWVKIVGWQPREAAEAELLASVARYDQQSSAE